MYSCKLSITLVALAVVLSCLHPTSAESIEDMKERLERLIEQVEIGEEQLSDCPRIPQTNRDWERYSQCKDAEGHLNYLRRKIRELRKKIEEAEQKSTTTTPSPTPSPPTSPPTNPPTNPPTTTTPSSPPSTTPNPTSDSPPTTTPDPSSPTP